MSNLLPLPPPPPPSPPPETPPWSTPLSRWQTPRSTPWRTPPCTRSTPVALNQVVISKQPVSQKSPGILKSSRPDAEPKKEAVILRQPRSSRTNPWIWCGAGLCFVFSLVLIFFGIATLIVYLAVKPRNPVFEIPNANLNTIYFDSPVFFNGDLTLLANFSNPNKKINVRFEYLDIELFFSNRLIAMQGIPAFSQRRGETRLEAIHLMSSLVYLPENHAVELKRQVLNNRINYEIRGTFKVRADLGMIHYSYWLHGRCQLQMSGPPTGVLVSHRCSTKR